MEFEKLQTASLKELFISSVEDKILSGELPIGAQLPTERELAEMMDVSRGVVNSGIAEMAHKGFLEVRPRVGTFVADYRRVGKSDIFPPMCSWALVMCSVMVRRPCTITCSNCWCSCSTAIPPGRWRWWRRT